MTKMEPILVDSDDEILSFDYTKSTSTFQSPAKKKTTAPKRAPRTRRNVKDIVTDDDDDIIVPPKSIKSKTTKSSSSQSKSGGSSTNLPKKVEKFGSKAPIPNRYLVDPGQIPVSMSSSAISKSSHGLSTTKTTEKSAKDASLRKALSASSPLSKAKSTTYDKPLGASKATISKINEKSKLPETLDDASALSKESTFNTKDSPAQCRKDNRNDIMDSIIFGGLDPLDERVQGENTAQQKSDHEDLPAKAAEENTTESSEKTHETRNSEHISKAVDTSNSEKAKERNMTQPLPLSKGPINNVGNASNQDLNMALTPSRKSRSVNFLAERCANPGNALLGALDDFVQSVTLERETDRSKTIAAINQLRETYKNKVMEVVEEVNTKWDTGCQEIIKQAQAKYGDIDDTIEALVKETQTNLEAIVSNNNDAIDRACSQFEVSKGRIQEEISVVEAKVEEKQKELEQDEVRRSVQLEFLKRQHSSLSERAAAAEAFFRNQDLENEEMRKRLADIQSRVDSTPGIKDTDFGRKRKRSDDDNNEDDDDAIKNLGLARSIKPFFRHQLAPLACAAALSYFSLS